MQKQLYLLDGSGYIFRAYYALPPLTRADGLPTGAIFGFCQMLLNILDKNPAHMVVVFDSDKKNFRHDIYHAYKSNRGETPADLIPQFPFFREATEALGIPQWEALGYEADDVIASLAERGVKDGYKVVIYSSDKDMMQLLAEDITIIDPIKNKKIDEAAVMKKFGVKPHQVADVQALMGDPSDGFPGIKGIGPKTASQLINQFGGLQPLLRGLDKIANDRWRGLLQEGQKEAQVFYQLALLRKDVPLAMSPDNLPAPTMTPEQLQTALAFFDKMEFKKLATKWREKFSLPVVAGDDEAVGKEGGGDKGGGQEKKIAGNSAKTIPNPPSPLKLLPAPTMSPPLPLGDEKHRTALLQLLNTDPKCGVMMMAGYLLIATMSGAGFFYPLDASSSPSSFNPASPTPLDLFDGGVGAKTALPAELVELLTRPDIVKFCYDSQAVFSLLAGTGEEGLGEGLEGVGLLQFCLGGGDKNNDFVTESAIEKFLKAQKKEGTIDNIILKGAEWAYDMLRYGMYFRGQLHLAKLARIYYQIERPLTPLLVRMRQKGVAIDVEKLADLGRDLDEKIAHLAKEIFADLGEECNLSSPKQLAEILFVKKKMGGGQVSKTKTGQFSTASDVLESLAGDYPVVANILEHRHLEKLNNTYVRALPTWAVPDPDGVMRIHSYLSQTGAQTGRLSSLNPNLQNIPIRTESGIALRECFIAPPKHDKLLLSLDYSQIELRILALLSGVGALREAFAKGTDIHQSTASEVFETNFADVTPLQRRQAKAVNFGIIYGISPYGLARQLQISNSQAKDIIDKYHEKMPGILEFMKGVVQFCENHGYVETLFGRRIYIPAISTKGPAKKYAERQAMNAPLQGTAADIIKRAMVAVDQYLTKQGLQDDCQMILQIHDELLFEVSADRAETIAPLLADIMATVSIYGLQQDFWQNPSSPYHDCDMAGLVQEKNGRPTLPFPVKWGMGANWRMAGS